MFKCKQWIGTRAAGLARFDGVTWTAFNSENSDMLYNCIYDITFDVDGLL